MTTWDDTTRSRDDSLLDRVRAGDTGAFGELWRLHSGTALSVARGFSGLDADDIVAETFEKLLRALRGGKGPAGAFRPYLIASVRNVARDHYRSRSRRESGDEDLDLIVDDRVLNGEQVAVRSQDHIAAAEAFQSLPDRWREALWYSEVDGLPPRQLSSVLGISANGASALVLRAKRGFRDAWVSAQLTRVRSDECRPIVADLGAYTRDGLSARDRKRVDQHLLTCRSCTAALNEAKAISQTLALVLLPVVAGAAGAATYLSSAPAASMPLALGAGATLGPADTIPAVPRSGAGLGRRPLVITGAVAGLLALAAVALWGITASTGEPVAGPPATGSAPGGVASPRPSPEPSGVRDGKKEGEEAGLPTPSPTPPAGGSVDAVPPARPARPVPAPFPAVPDPAAPLIPIAPPRGEDAIAAPTAAISQIDSRMFPTITGTDAAPGARITLIGDAGQVVGETRADARGRWTARAAELRAGRGEVSVVQIVDGVASRPSAAMPYVVDEPPRPASPVEAETVEGARFVFRLTAPAGTVIQRMLPGSATVQTLTIPDGGVWNEYLAVPAGEHVLHLRYANPRTRDFGPWSATPFSAN